MTDDHLRGGPNWKSGTLLFNAVVSMGGRNTQLKPTWQ
jgi:hypothetical protein